MDTIRDSDLILYHYRDGLDAAELAAIARALEQSPALRARYAALAATLQAADAQPLPQPDAGFEQRLWQRFDAEVEAAAPRQAVPHAREAAAGRERHGMGARRPLRLAAGALALVGALGLGFLLGRQPADGPTAPVAGTGMTNPAGMNAGDTLSSRVLDAYVAAHLRETEGVVLTAVNSDSAELLAGNRELAAGLIDSNRLYAQAAARAGNARLANFLQQLEPLLIELANPPGAGPIQDSDGLRDYVDKTDLLFQLRATQARMEPQRQTST
ncbi:hypothetical protein [Tahibacter harae]|uniref:Zinc-finger domain-containing protein n=1 Tax=Tahibacter harae TaxID=2963937 RepID=A0ABT1QY08_9GAMM|nr:hypothetical protein [Tahibacter harae]MCQ4167184.1 hypothetical protein [Tahibacter harae]